MKIFDKLKRAADPRAKVVSNDLKRLNDVRPGLGDQAVDYVLDGRNETVLASISSTCKGDELEVCKAYLGHASPSWARRQLLATQDPFDIDFAKRYTDVLAATCTSLPDTAAGTEKAPKDVRVFFSEAFEGVIREPNRWPPEPASIGDRGLSVGVASALAHVLGGTPVDLVDVIYNERGRYGSISGKLYRSAVDVGPLLKDRPEDVTHAGRRLHAVSRAALVQDLHEHNLVSVPTYLEFVVELAGDSSKAVRETASSVLSAAPASVVEPKAIAHLDGGNVNMRAGMVELLGKMGTKTAMAALRTHKDVEKTARVVAAIDAVLTASEYSADMSSAADEPGGYLSLDGTRVEIPKLTSLEDEEAPRFGDEARRTLKQLIAEENQRIKKRNEENTKAGYAFRAPPLSSGLAGEAVALFNSDEPGRESVSQELSRFVTWGPGTSWTRTALAKLPQKKALRLAASVSYGPQAALSTYAQGPFADRQKQFLSSENGDVRHLERMEIDMGSEISFSYGPDLKARKVQKGDLLRSVIQDDYAYMSPQLDVVPIDALWPYLAENLDVIDEAFGLKPIADAKLSRVAAIRALRRLPKTPARYFGPLLEAATGETKSGRDEARSMLQSAAQVDQHIVALLDDSRQAIRAGAAEWIAERKQRDAIPALRKRLKKEKSELAKAAILTSLEILGEDLSGFLGPKALQAEAEKGLKKAKLDKLDWMALDHLPHARYRSGKRVPDEVLRWWLFLAVKLKQPGGNALFDIYLDQLEPVDAESLSTWVLESWVNYDTARPSESEANAHAKNHAAQRFQYFKQWYKDYSEEQAFADLKREFLSAYLNTGAPTKGLLALAKRASPSLAADRVRAYLKNHGSRTSQASALLDMLAGSGDPVTLQVLISAATRLKQKGVQKFAASLVEKVAEANHWTLDELADRTIPSAGLDDDGVLELPCGPQSRVYAARIDDSLTLRIRNPDGKSVKSLPAGKDDATKASKKQLSASRRELKQIIAMQSARLYEALCSGRVWPVSDWLRDLHQHPIMSRLVQRVVWLGLDEAAEVCGSFRPTAEGDFTDASDDAVDIHGFHGVRLAYGAELADAEAQAWATHLKDYEVSPLFTQFGRSLLTLDSSDVDTTVIDDRKGWVTDTFAIRGVAAKLGYERGEAMDGGYFNEYIKVFQGAGVRAVIEFSGNCLPEENVPAAMISLSFAAISPGGRTGRTMKLSDVPRVLLSECWNDYRSMAAKAAFDENWEQKMPWT